MAENGKKWEDFDEDNYSKVSESKRDKKIHSQAKGQHFFLDHPLVLVTMPWQKADTAWLSDLFGWAAAKSSIYSLHVN